jgi:peptide/nickel transport system permease protein
MSEADTPVLQLIGKSFLFTFILLLITLIFTLIIAIPVGVYSATHKYTVVDYLLSFFAFLGMAIPPFLLSLGYMFISVFYLNAHSIGGLFSPGYESYPWWGKLFDFLKHLPIPVIIIGLTGTAIMMRIMRGNLLDILGSQYIQTARAKGLKEFVVIYKHAVRIAINPIISRIGMYLPEVLSASMIVAIVLNLPTIGPVFYRSLIQQDMYLAGAILFIIAAVLLFMNLIADILLAWSDPRIRYD